MILRWFIRLNRSGTFLAQMVGGSWTKERLYLWILVTFHLPQTFPSPFAFSEASNYCKIVLDGNYCNRFLDGDGWLLQNILECDYCKCKQRCAFFNFLVAPAVFSLYFSKLSQLNRLYARNEKGKQYRLCQSYMDFQSCRAAHIQLLILKMLSVLIPPCVGEAPFLWYNYGVILVQFCALLCGFLWGASV